jgi:hypothetical protein
MLAQYEGGGRVDNTQGNINFISEHCLILNLKKFIGTITKSLPKFWAFIKSNPQVSIFSYLSLPPIIKIDQSFQPHKRPFNIVNTSLPRACTPPGLVKTKLRTPGANKN